VISIWIAPGIPDLLASQVRALGSTEPDSFLYVEDPASARVRVEAFPERPLTTWIFAVVAPFPTVEDGLSADDLRQAWAAPSGNAAAWMVTTQTEQALGPLLGEPGAGIQVVETDADLVDRAWGTRPSRAVVPFESLDPRWKVLELDGQSPLRKDFTPGTYALAVPFGLSGDPAAVDAVQARLGWPASNRDPARLSVVVVTGVTALTRATAWMMDLRGVDFPGDLVGDWLRQADITHVSNEVSFSETCPPADPSPANMRFCSAPGYIQLLEDVGVDVVELTGNHLIDWGQPAMLYTLDLYRQLGWLTFGGGADLEASMQPALLEDHGNKIAFLGCNPAGPSFDWATSTTPGSTPCDKGRLFGELADLRAQGYITIFTFQWPESYRYAPLPDQVAGFREAVDAGATIVSGSQAHQPQGFEFYNGSFIHYGLGNLFFDQMWSEPTREEFIDRYVFYDGRHIGTELLTAHLEEYAQPRPMTPDERTSFLETLFAASGW
jgi:poly-gamma-glutamate synthesis protein (capsule biosynthesis protein)